MLYRVIGGEPDIAGVPEPLRALVARCLAKESAERSAMREVLITVAKTTSSPRVSAPPRLETIVRGAKCTRQGRLTMRPGDDKLLLTYFPNGSGREMACSGTATVYRKGV